MNNIKKRLEEFNKKFGRAGSSGSFKGIRDDGIKAFISAKIHQAIAEERKRGRKAWIQGNVISYKKPTYQSAFFEAEEVVILSSLDTTK